MLIYMQKAKNSAGVAHLLDNRGEKAMIVCAPLLDI